MDPLPPAVNRGNRSCIARSTAGAMGDSSAMISSNGTNATASLICPNCNLDLVGFPAGLRFDPTDQELIEHLESMVEGGGSRAHPLINHFIPTIEGGNDICYTHPENLPGVTRDGLSKHFFHKTTKAYPNGPRKKRKIMSQGDHVGEAYWHKTGKTCPVIIGGKQKGCKKILVLHNGKPGTRDRTNWVMHQYHLGVDKDEKDGELVLSKVLYRCPDAAMIEENDEKEEMTSEVTPNILPVSGAAAVTASTVTFAQLPPAKVFQEAGVSDQAQVQGNDHHIPSQNHVQSVDREPDTTLSLGLSTGW